VKSCVECIVGEAKYGKREGFLSAINNEPLQTYHIDHIGPIGMTKKSSRRSMVVFDALSKNVWLSPTKSAGADEVVDRMERQSEVFGNPSRIITDRGTAFTANVF